MSHANVDEEVAHSLKAAIESSFASVEVFVSSDPEDLAPGDPWVDKILGKVRKQSLPPPFSQLQAVNLDEEKGLRALWAELQKQFGSEIKVPDFTKVALELIRLDVRAEERLSILNDPLMPEVRKSVEANPAKLNQVQEEGLRLLILEGELTDRYALQKLQETGILLEAWASLFEGIGNLTGFVQKVPGSGVRGGVTKFSGQSIESWSLFCGSTSSRKSKDRHTCRLCRNRTIGCAPKSLLVLVEFDALWPFRKHIVSTTRAVHSRAPRARALHNLRAVVDASLRIYLNKCPKPPVVKESREAYDG